MEMQDRDQELKEIETGSDPDTDKDYASFEAGNRKRRLIIISAAIVVGVVSIAALVATMGSIGKMSAQVEDAFYEPEAPGGAEAGTAKAPAAAPAADPTPAAPEEAASAPSAASGGEPEPEASGAAPE